VILMDTPTKRKPQPMLTRKKLREYSYNLQGLYLPKELEDYLLELYNEEEFLDDEGCWRSLTEEDIWYNIRCPLHEYAQIKRKMDDLLSNTEYLGNCTLTIRVHNNKRDDLLRWAIADAEDSRPKTIVNEESDDVPF